MPTFSTSNTNSHYNPNEPRDWHGRWTTGGSSWRANPVRRPSPAGRAHLLLGHAHASAWHQGLIRQFKLPTDTEAEQFARTIRTWNAASDLDPATFHDRFTHGLVDKPATVARLRQAAAGAAETETIGQMVDASRPLTQAIRDIGADRWPWVREGLADKAAAAMPMQFGAHVGTTAATVSTGQTGMAAGDRPRGCGLGSVGEGQSSVSAKESLPSSARPKFQEAAMSGMKLYKTPEGYFDLASIFNSDPVPMLDDQGNPVIGASGKPVMIPKLADPHFFVDRGLEVITPSPNELSDTASLGEILGRIYYYLKKFSISGPWDLQRNPTYDDSLRDGATIAIGLFGAAAGIPEEMLLKIEDHYAAKNSNFAAKDTRDDTYTHLPRRNVLNTHIGYELYRSHRIGPSQNREGL